MHAPQTVLVEVIGRILDINRMREIDAVARWVHGPEASEAIVAADIRQGIWKLSRRSGQTIDDSTRSGSRRQVPLLARLCFPLDLGIWSRRGDDWSIAEATEVQGGYTIALVHRETRDRSELFYDSAYRLLTRWTGFGGDRSVLWELSLIEIQRPLPTRSGLAAG